MKLRPAGHRVLVRLKPTTKEEVSDGGIILETAKSFEAKRRSTQEAYVVSIGQNAFKDFGSGEPWCEEGDLVLIAKYSGEDRKDPKTDEIYRIINDEDIFAVVVEE